MISLFSDPIDRSDDARVSITLLGVEEALAGRARAGDADAVAALVDRHYDALIGYLYRMTGGDRPLAEDLAQDTFLRAIKGLDGYDPARRFKPWLYAIATNAARTHYTRAETRFARAALPADDPIVGDRLAAPDGEDGYTQIEADDDARRVIVALGTLSAGAREVVTLYYYQDLKLSEIAEALNIPLGTVKSRLSIAIARLRAALV